MKSQSWAAVGAQALAIIILSSAASANADPLSKAQHFDIAAQATSDALNAFSEQSGLRLLFSYDAVAGRQADAVNGDYTSEQVLKKLLDGTDLHYEITADSVVLIRDSQPIASAGQGTPREGGASPPFADEGRRAGDGGFMRVAQPEGQDSSSEGDKQTAESPGKGSQDKVQEIVVTAQKRVERLQDVPVPVTAISAASLVNSNQLRLEDYYSSVPGLNLVAIGSTGNSAIAVRGLTTGGFTNPTVGIVIDDVPFGASTMGGSTGSGILAYDLDPSELERIELLRGPQGTLYGASSLGGLLKYVTVAPSTDRFSGRVQFGATGVSGSEEIRGSVRGALNVPFSDTFAVRISASSRQDPGYLDNLRTGESDVNDVRSQSARIAALWEPADNFSLQLSALRQHTERLGSTDIHLPSEAGPQTGIASGRPDLDDLEQSAFPGTGRYERDYEAFSASMTLDLGSAELTSLTGYNSGEITEVLDRSPQFGISRSQTHFGVGGYVPISFVEISKVSQELRLHVPITGSVDWLVGAYYTTEDYPGVTRTYAINETTGAVAATWNTATTRGDFTEYAAFTNLTLAFSEQFDLQVGGRFSHNTMSTGPTNNQGPLISIIFGIPSGTLTFPQFKASDDAYTFTVAPRLKITPDLMLYARVASGYRPGGPNTSALLLGANLPAQYGPDTTINYEIGGKGDAFDGRLSFDASLYHIVWQDVQVPLQSTGTGSTTLFFTDNAGEAISEGVEVSITAHPWEGLTIASWAAYNNAELTDVPSNITLNVSEGARLPYGAEWSGSLAIDKRFALSSNVVGFLGASINYVGERQGAFVSGSPQGIFPSYTQANLRVGAEFDGWTLSAFVNNATDERGVLRAGRDADIPYAVTYTQPRTFGISVSAEF